jgi:hypothetical protein
VLQRVCFLFTHSGSFLSAETVKEAEASKSRADQWKERRLTAGPSAFSSSTSSLPLSTATQASTNSPSLTPLPNSEITEERDKEKEKEGDVDKSLLVSLEEKNNDLSKRLKSALLQLDEAKKEKEEMEVIIRSLLARMETIEKFMLEKEKEGNKGDEKRKQQDREEGSSEKNEDTSEKKEPEKAEKESSKKEKKKEKKK